MTFETRSLLLTACFAAAALATASVTSVAQPPGGRQGQSPVYDRATETTLECTVERVEEIDPETCPGCQGGIHLSATCAGEALEIHLGPVAFLEEKSFEVEEGDEIEVTGSRVTYEGKASLIAKELRKGETVLQLRDDQGRPLWRRGRR